MLKGTYKKTTNPVATYGENSASTLTLQKSLNAKGAKLTLDGKYGDLTRNAYAQYGGQVAPIADRVGYASSTAKAGEFASDSKDLNNKMLSPDGKKEETGASGFDDAKVKTKEPKLPNLKGGEGDVELNNKDKEIAQWEQDQKSKAEKLYKSDYARYDSTYASDQLSINNLFNDRIETRKKLDKLSLDRMKAYGISASQYVPIEYTDAVTNREQETADSIKGLEAERMDLLAKAKVARDTGQSKSLRDNLEAVNKIEESMRTQIKGALELAQAQNKLALDNYNEQKTRYLEDMSNMAKRALSLYGDEYFKATTQEQKDAILKKALGQFGDPEDINHNINLKTAFNNDVATKNKTALETEKDKLGIEKLKVDINDTKASTAKKYADMARDKRNEGKDEPNMIKDIKSGLGKKGGDKLDENGYLRPEAWDFLDRNSGLKRETLVKELGGKLYLDDKNYQKYGLSKAEYNAIIDK